MINPAKKVLITCYYGLVARNFMRGHFLDRLLAEDIVVTFSCPAWQEPYLKTPLERSGVKLVSCPRVQHGPLASSWWWLINTLMWNNPGRTRTMFLKWLDHTFQNRRFFTGALAALLGSFGAGSYSWLDRLLERIDLATYRNPGVSRLLDEEQPDLIITTHMFGPEMAVMAEAKRRGIPTLGVVKSWDNLTSKTRMRIKPDRMLVWSPMMRDEAIRLHHVPPERIHLVGAPQFDQYAREGRITPRDVFWQQHGVDPHQKIILYSPGVKFTLSDHANLKVLHDVISADDFPFSCHIHVRQYPKKPLDFSELERNLGLTTENAGRVVPAWEDSVDQTEEEVHYLDDLMHNIDVMVQFGSTIALDACCRNKPIIAWNLDWANPQCPRRASRSRHHECTHNRYPITSGAVTLANSRSELRQTLIEMLRDPTAGTDARSATVEKLAWRIDGNAKERIAHHALSLLNTDV